MKFQTDAMRVKESATSLHIKIKVGAEKGNAGEGAYFGKRSKQMAKGKFRLDGQGTLR